MMSLIFFIQLCSNNLRETLRRWSNILFPKKRGE